MSSNKSGKIRITGGHWKNRLIRFNQSPGLRPSADATRETLFNWLGHDLDAQHCLDLFAGSGALGFEAASRGASVVMVESNRLACQKIRQNSASLLQDSPLHASPSSAPPKNPQIEVLCMDVMRYLKTTRSQYNLVFLDPPFAKDLWRMTCDFLSAGDALATAAKIYIESADAFSPLSIDPNWHIIQASKRGSVHSTLIQT